MGQEQNTRLLLPVCKSLLRLHRETQIRVVLWKSVGKATTGLSPARPHSVYPAAGDEITAWRLSARQLFDIRGWSGTLRLGCPRQDVSSRGGGP